MTQIFHSAPPILRFTNKNNYKVNQLIRHNFRIGIPENVNPKLSQYNFYFIAKQPAPINNELGFKATKQLKLQLLTTIENDWKQQQAAYSPSKRISFNDFCSEHNTFVDVVLPGTRQEWFEKQDICQFTDEFVWDKFTQTRKMGKLIVESINETKMQAWFKAEISFMKQWMQQKLGTDKGFLYATVHLDETTPHIHFGFMPITKVFSKTLKQDRLVISHNKIFGGKQLLQSFNNYHANYLTKAGFAISGGMVGSKGSYNELDFKQVKDLERNRAEAELAIFLINLKSQKQSFANYQTAIHYKKYYDERIKEIKKYLLLEELTDYEKNQLKHYLLLLEKVNYYKIINCDFTDQQKHQHELAFYEQKLDEMTIKMAPILTKSYHLTI